jgi:hypothetical protein
LGAVRPERIDGVPATTAAPAMDSLMKRRLVTALLRAFTSATLLQNLTRFRTLRKIVSNHVLTKVAKGNRSRPVAAGVIEHDSKETPTIQLCDVLLDAAATGYQKELVSAPKLELRQFIAAHLGWAALRWDTWSYERKSNIWVFHDPTRQPPMRRRSRLAA